MGRIYWNVGIHKDHGTVSGCSGCEFHYPGCLEHLQDLPLIVQVKDAMLQDIIPDKILRLVCKMSE